MLALISHLALVQACRDGQEGENSGISPTLLNGVPSWESGAGSLEMPSSPTSPDWGPSSLSSPGNWLINVSSASLSFPRWPLPEWRWVLDSKMWVWFRH